MKKLFFFFIFIVSSLLLYGCDDSEQKVARDFEDVYYENYALFSQYNPDDLKERLLRAVDEKDADEAINDWMDSMKNLVEVDTLKELIKKYIPDLKAYQNDFYEVNTRHQTVLKNEDSFSLCYYVEYLSDNGYSKFFNVNLKISNGKISAVLGDLDLGDDF